jgi:hypothetical protein
MSSMLVSWWNFTRSFPLIIPWHFPFKWLGVLPSDVHHYCTGKCSRACKKIVLCHSLYVVAVGHEAEEVSEHHWELSCLPCLVWQQKVSTMCLSVFPLLMIRLKKCKCCSGLFFAPQNCSKFWAEHNIVIYTHCWELMKSVGTNGSLSLLFIMKVMVWHFVSNSHKVVTALLVMLPPKCCGDFSAIS